MVSKAYYQEKLASTLESAEQEIERLQGDDTVDQAIKLEQIESLQQRIALIQEKLSQLSEGEETLWLKMKHELEDILKTMGAGFEGGLSTDETDAVTKSRNSS